MNVKDKFDNVSLRFLANLAGRAQMALSWSGIWKLNSKSLPLQARQRTGSSVLSSIGYCETTIKSKPTSIGNKLFCTYSNNSHEIFFEVTSNYCVAMTDKAMLSFEMQPLQLCLLSSSKKILSINANAQSGCKSKKYHCIFINRAM